MRFINTYGRGFGVERLCQVMGLAPSTYYWRRARLGTVTARALSDSALLERIEAIHEQSRGTYGAPRVHAALAEQGWHVGRKRVERLMRQHGLKGAYRPRYFTTTETSPDARTAADLVDRNFTADRPNQLWVADFTYIRTMQGFLFLAAILDVFSRMVVGWSTSDAMATSLVQDALAMALSRRKIIPSKLVHHSDRGSQYTSFAFSRNLVEAGIAASMGSKGDAYDNAMIESFFGTIKIELIHRQRWHTRHEAEMAIFSYIEGFYNTTRLHSSLGYRSPRQFEETAESQPTGL